MLNGRTDIVTSWAPFWSQNYTNTQHNDQSQKAKIHTYNLVNYISPVDVINFENNKTQYFRLRLYDFYFDALTAL